jgi:hypothetical protein
MEFIDQFAFRYVIDHLEISPLPLVKVEKAKRITRDKFPAALTVCI